MSVTHYRAVLARFVARKASHKNKAGPFGATVGKAYPS
jgi:hypothetical protein